MKGGDRRSLAQAAEALELVRHDQTRIAELVELTGDADPLVAYRACDVLEKLAHDDMAAVSEFRHVFVQRMTHPYWEARLQCVRAVSLFEWGEAERVEVITALRERLDDEKQFVRAWALDSFAAFANGDETLQGEVDARIREFLGSQSKALQARARAIAKCLAADL